MFTHIDMPFCETDYALCEPGYCYLGSLIRGPELYLNIAHWRMLKAYRESPDLYLVIPTISQDSEIVGSDG